MKRAVIVHCWSGTPNYCWYPWTERQLTEYGFQVGVPAMPETDAPKLDLWLPKLVETIGEPDEELVLIGHSIGCGTIMRYLETLPAGVKIGGVVFVAGFTEDLGFAELENFYETPLEFELIKSHIARGSVLIQSDNDPYVDAKYGKELSEKLGGKLVFVPGAKHFSGSVDDPESCTQLPEVIDAVKELGV